MMQIEKQREDYYRKLGTPPGVPTMKGATAEPENTHEGYNTIIKELGDHSVPDGWIQRPKRNAVPGTPPGPPVQWDKAEDPDDVQPGYGYVPADTTHEDIFFYHTDHLGSTSYITDAKANVAQFDAYLPYGELLVDEHSSTEEMPYKFNGKEFDEETGLYYYGARYMNPRTSLWYGVDALIENYPTIGSYTYCSSNPIVFIDPDGNKKVVVTGGADKHNKYEMNFVNASKIQLDKYLKRAGSLEEISWLIFGLGYSQEQKQEIAKWANNRGVSFKFLDTAEQLVNELNSSSRSNDKLTEVSMFSHGTASNVSFGFGLHGDRNSTNYSNKDNLTEATLNKTPLLSSAFAKGGRIDLYSCNSGTPLKYGETEFKTEKELRYTTRHAPSLVTLMGRQSKTIVRGFVGRSDYTVSIQYSPSFSDMFCFLSLCKKTCLHSTKQMFTVFVVLLLICVRESSAYVNSYVVMTSTLLTVVSMCFIIALATASNCSIGNVVALLCITSRWRRAV